MTSTRSLPDELLSLVFRHLDTNEDRQTIFALRAVNKQCNHLARPLVHCTLIDDINQHRQLNEPAIGPLQRTAWDIVQHPELAPFIKSIQFRDWDHIGRNRVSPLPEGIQPPSSEHYAACLNAANLPIEVHEAILKQLSEETPNGHLSLLLAICSDLEFLKAPSGYGQFGSLIVRVLLGTTRNASEIILPPHPNTLPKTSLRSLRDLHLGGNQYQSGVRHILPLLCLPSLHCIHVHGLEDSHIWTDHTLPDQPSTFITHNPVFLTFDSCMLSGPGLSRILSACEKPKALTVRWRPGLSNDHLTNEAIGQAIREFGQQLEFLHLDTTDVYKRRYRHDDNATPQPFGSFVSLSNLKTLAVPRFAFARENCSAVYIVSVLPPSLEELYVLGVGNEGVESERVESEAFARVCPEAKEMLPCLKKVVMVPWHHHSFEEYFGTVNHRSVDYNVEEAKRVKLRRLS